MSDKKDDVERQRSLMPRQRAPDEVLEELRRLYAHYGADPVPQRILDLAKEVERELGRAVREQGRVQLPDSTPVPRQK